MQKFSNRLKQSLAQSSVTSHVINLLDGDRNGFWVMTCDRKSEFVNKVETALERVRS